MSSLDVLGISEHEEKIYRILLVSGQLSAGEIQFALKTDLNEVKTTLEKLVERELIREIPGIDNRYACLLPVGAMKDELIAAASEVEKLSSDLETTGNNVVTDLETSLENQVQQFEAETQRKKDEFTSQVSGLQASVSEKQAAANASLEENINKLSTEYGNLATSIEEKSITRATSNADLSNETISGLANSINERTTQTKTREEEIKQQTMAQLPEMDSTKIDNATTEIVEKIESYKNFHDMSVNELQQGLNTKINEFQGTFRTKSGEISGLQESLSSELEKTATKLSSTAEIQFDNLKTSTDNIKNTFQTDVEGSLTPLKELKTSVDTYYDQLRVDTNSTKSKMMDGNTKFSDMYNQEINRFSTSIQEVIGSTEMATADYTQELTTKLKESMTSSTATAESQLQEMVNKLISDVKQQFEQLNASFASSLEQISGQLKTKREEQKNQLETKLQSTTSKLQESTTGTIQQNQSNLDELFSALDAQRGFDKNNTQQQIDNVLKSMQELATQFESKLTTYQNQIGQNKDLQVGELSQLVTDHQASIQQNFTSSLGGITTDLNQMISELKSLTSSSTSSSLETYTETHTEMLNTLNTEVNELKTELVGAYETLNQQLTNTVNQMYQTYINLVDETATSTLSASDTLKENNNSLKEDLEQIYNSAKEDMSTQFSTFRETLQNSISQLGTALSSDVQSLITSSSNVTVSAYGAMKELVESGTGNQIATLQKAFDEYNQKYSSTTSKVANKATSLAGLLDGIFQIQKDTPTIEIATTHIVGTEAIKQQMTGILSRVKSKATILVPKIDMVDDQTILKMPRTAQITIISYIDERTDKSWIEKMHNATANVTIRSISQAEGSLPDFLGCEREGEEIMLAIKDEKAKTYLGITSLSEDFVKILGNIVIADYARGKSKQIAK